MEYYIEVLSPSRKWSTQLGPWLDENVGKVDVDWRYEYQGLNVLGFWFEKEHNATAFKVKWVSHKLIKEEEK